MIDHNVNTFGGFGPAPAPVLQQLSIVQHNCLGSWNVFSSLFISLKTVTQTPSFFLLQDPPVFRNRLPSFVGFKAFVPKIQNGMLPKVACYVYYEFLQTYSILPVFFEWPDWMALDVHTPSGLFVSNHHILRMYNGYSTNGTLYVRTVTPDKMFQDHDFPCLVVGDFNVHNPLSDPLREYSA